MAKAKKNKSLSPLLIGAIIVAILVVVVGVYKYNKSNTATNQAQVQTETQLVQTTCNIAGEPIIDINQQIVNDSDTSATDAYWANDSYDQNVKIWQKEGNTYCAELRFTGTYDAQEGMRSPGNNQAILTGTEDGTLDGVEVVEIVGTQIAEPVWPKSGSVGTIDFQCDLEGNCPDNNLNQWYNQYFTDIQDGYPKTVWYEWNYRNGNNVWVDSTNGSSGDIL